MKILVCADGSENSKKALTQAALIAECSNIDEVAVIHVYEGGQSAVPLFVISEKQEKLMKLVAEEMAEERNMIISDALTVFEEVGVKARAIIKEGHPSHTIVNVAEKEGFNMIFIGSRGLSGLEKVFLGSVSNAVVQEAQNCSVVVVK
jgi:nucleotide-binding universal stress UspA family protein